MDLKDKSRAQDEESTDSSEADFEPVLVWKRWLMLAIFTSLSMLNAFQWIHLNIVADSTICLWNGSMPDGSNPNIAISWLSMLYMLVYIPFIIPVTWLLDKHGLRISIILGAVFNALGAWIKCVSVELVAPVGTSGVTAASSFGVLMLGQVFCSISQVFILGMPPHVSATWFGQHELAVATALGVFGNQVGVALGFGIPPLIVPAVTPETDLSNNLVYFDELKRGFKILFYSVAVIVTVDLLIVLFFFKEKPAIAPNRAQHLRLLQRHLDKKLVDLEEGDSKVPAQEEKPDVSFIGSFSIIIDNFSKRGYRQGIINLFKNCAFNLLNICYGTNTGIYHAISTLLSIILLEKFPTSNVAIGWIGFTMVIAGLIGSIVAGFILEKTGKYRLILIIFYLMSVASFAAFIGSNYGNNIIYVFITMFLLGFFQSGFLPIGFEYGAEITYPENEGLSAGILNTSAHIIGIAITYLSTELMDRFGGFSANMFMCSCLAVAAIPVFFLKDDLKRQQAQAEIIGKAELEIEDKESVVA